jgi:hypothetical protein
VQIERERLGLPPQMKGTEESPGPQPMSSTRAPAGTASIAAVCDERYPSFTP